MSENLNRLIAKAKPSSALLTTYTFSLSYFEAAILPTLRRHGCRNIAVMVDESHYLGSLDEAHSSNVGREYRLIPVRAPGGEIFHPKVAYFLCEESDAFVVSSGNLTFPGQGGNIECIDAVSAINAPDVFVQVAGFFEGLAKSMPGEANQAATVLHEYAIRARQQASLNSTANGTRHAWLIHTLEQSASAQLVNIAQTLSRRYRRLTVLAPFHAPDAMPILAFAKTLKIEHVALGLDPKTKRIALDAKRFKSDKTVSFVVPVIVDDERESHSKWFELTADEGTLVMTGSVNATTQSFNSTSNVEVSLVRWVDTTGIVWKDETPSEMKYEPFHTSQRAKNCGFADAVLLDDGQLIGFVQGVQFAAGQVVVQILCQGEVVFQVDNVSLSENGRFRCRIEARFAQEDHGLQVFVRNDEFEAAGWISSEVQLEATEAERQKIVAIARVLSDAFTADDVHQVLSMLLNLTQSPVLGPVSGGGKPSANKKIEPPKPFSFTLWQQSGHHGLRPGLLTGAPARMFDALYSWLTNSFEGNSEQTGENQKVVPMRGEPHEQHRPPVNKKRKNDMLSDGDNGRLPTPDDDAKVERNQQLMLKLLQIIPVKLAENPSHPSAAELAEVVGAFALKNAQRLANLHLDASTTTHSCLSWLDTFSRMNLNAEARTKLQPYAVAMGCIALQIVEDHSAAGSIAGKIKEGLQRFGIRADDQDALRSLCISGAAHRAFASIKAGDRNRLVDEIPNLSRTKTAAAVLNSLLERVRNQELLKISAEENAMFGVDFTRTLQEHQMQRKKQFGVVKRLEHAGCPCCHVTLKADTIKRLQRTNAAICQDCFRALVWLPTDTRDPPQT